MSSRSPLGRHVGPLVDEIMQAVPHGDWVAVSRLADAIEALDPGNQEAAVFRRMAQRVGGTLVSSSNAPAAADPLATFAATPPHAHSHAVGDMVESVRDLAPFSDVARRIISLLDDEFSAVDDIARVAGTDPALTARILRTANSAFYRRRVRVGTIRDAIVVLGAQEVRSIVVASCLVGSLPKTQRLDHNDFWQFSLAVALLADMIARSEGDLSGDAFTAGIVHNIGLLVLDRYCPRGLEEVTTLVADGRRRLHDRELIVFGTTDAVVGERLATRWGLPQAVVRAISSHGKRHDEVTDRDKVVSAVIRGRRYARAQGMSDGLERSATRPEVANWLPAGVERRIEGFGGWDGLLERLDSLLASAS